MQAYVCRRYGGPEVLELADVPKPIAKANEALVMIRATTVTSGDWRVRTLAMPKGFGPMARLALGFGGPRQPILGTSLAGVIEAVGEDVTRFKAGDAVFAFPGAKMGCHAEYRAVAETSPIALKPDNLSFEDAAALPFGGSTALHFLRKGGVKAGESMLVIGASGEVGIAMVQLASHLGCTVTGVTSTGNLALVSGLGAARAIDYRSQDLGRQGETYDVIVDTVGAAAFSQSRHLLTPVGRFLAVAGGLPDIFAAMWPPMRGGRRVVTGQAEERPEYVRQLADLAKAGAFRPVIDRRYEFAQMAQAHAYVETRRKRGSVVVRVAA